MHFDEYQKETWATNNTSRQPWVGLAQSTFGLTEKVGQVTACLKKRIRDGSAYTEAAFRAELLRSLGDVMWYLSSVSSHLSINLEDVARANLDFTKARWGIPSDQDSLFSRLFDEGFPETEQIPRRFTVRFVERMDAGRSWLPLTEVWVDGQRFGDPVDDNSPRQDNYRLHDALHLANAAVLGWSPVVRSLLRRKRKSKPEIDKYEDGARARDTEEALARLIHAEAERNHWFENVSVIDTAFLVRIQVFVSDLEVRVRSPQDWQRCILTGYAMFRQLREHKGGEVDISLIDQSMTFRAPAQ